MTYRLCMTVIRKGTYGTRDSMLEKLDVFLLNNRITREEYNELVSLLDNN